MSASVTVELNPWLVLSVAVSGLAFAHGLARHAAGMVERRRCRVWWEVPGGGSFERSEGGILMYFHVYVTEYGSSCTVKRPVVRSGGGYALGIPGQHPILVDLPEALRAQEAIDRAEGAAQLYGLLLADPEAN